MNLNRDFDAVVVGSGLGGLTAAALLAKLGHRVCVLERNQSLGGAASVFKVGPLTIEPSLHQTSDPRDPRDVKHAILQELGLLDEIEWLPVRPFFTIRGGPVGEPFSLPVGFAEARRALSARFPADEAAIGRVLDSMESIYHGLGDLALAREQSSIRRLLGGIFALRPLLAGWRSSLDDVLTRAFGDNEALKFALAGNMAYYADDPKRLWWVFFALAQGGFINSGGVYIKGGSRALSMKLA